MLTIATEEGICLLEFTDRRMLETEIKQLQTIYKAPVLPGKSKYFTLVEEQIAEYFEGTRKNFGLPLVIPGTPFQQSVWKVLQEIPYGTTRSYKQQALAIGNPNAIRAVAKANGYNRLCIIIPCHRVIGDDGHLTGYGGGIWRKKWLLDHEAKHR
jgi:AraC family transcriptional regulator of adaptative response/methylated-DNA-[protein]-cysteine methyltransferase